MWYLVGMVIVTVMLVRVLVGHRMLLLAMYVLLSVLGKKGQWRGRFKVLRWTKLVKMTGLIH